MKTYAHHHADTPHGLSHAPISISVLLTLLFVGAQWVVYVLMIVAVPMGTPTIYGGVNPFTVASAIVAALLMAFLFVDLRRNRLEAHGARRSQFIVFAAAALLLAMFAFFVGRIMLSGVPAT